MCLHFNELLTPTLSSNGVLHWIHMTLLIFYNTSQISEKYQFSNQYFQIKNSWKRDDL